MREDNHNRSKISQGRMAVVLLILAIIAVPAVALGTDLTLNATEPTAGVLIPGAATTPADPPAPGDENGTTVTGPTPVEVAQVDVTQTPDRVDTADTGSRLLSAGTALQGVIPDTNNVFLKVANSAGARFNDFGNDTYNIRWTGEPAASPDIDGGQNALHITADPSQQYGQLTYTDNQSGTFWVTDTGGRQYKDEILLLIAVNGTIPDDFKLHLQADGYQWVPNPIPHTPPAREDATYNNTALDEWFTKEDFIYGPQTWRPAAHAKYPLYPGQDVYDESNTFMMMLVDLNAGDRYGLDPVRVQYTVENLSTFMAVNAYAYSKNADTGVYNITCWTNRLLGNSGEFSGYYVSGSPPMPVAKVVVSPSELELPLNGKETFTATAYDELEREIKGASFVWTTTNQEVGTIDGFGHFTPKSAGETEVRATTGNVTGSAIVKVIEPVHIALDSISLSPSELILYDDDPKVHTFTATGYDQFGDLYADGVYTWSSSNETVCIVDTSGVAEILQYGNSTISAQNGTVTGKAEVTLKRRPDWNLKINGTTRINVNRTQFIELADKNPASYTDNKQDLWEGVSLSSLVGLVDDSDPSTFNATIAADTYKIRVKSTLNGDATSEFTSDELLSDKTFVVGYKLNGREIPEEVTGGRLYWPLKLHGTGCQDRSIERITDIEVYIRPQIQEIKISPASINVWDNSEPYKIPIQAFDSAGSVIPEEDYILNYTWDSSSPGVGTVNQSGYFSPVGIGKTTVSASIGDTCVTVEIQVVSSTAGRIYVGNTSGDFKTIQSAVEFSRDGDTIVVMNGTYRENVFIDHPVTIVSENGPDAAIVERGDQNAYAFTVQASDVTISGLGINGNIILKDGKYSNLIVDSNAITDGGICLSGVTSNSTIMNNSVITTSSIKGIDVKPSSNNNTICKNFVSTDMFGLFIDASSEGHIIADNTFNTSSKCFAYNSTFSNNTFLDGGTWYTEEALYLNGNGNSLTNNTIRSTQRLHALKLTGANVIVTGNTLKGGTSKLINSDGVSNVVFCMNNLIKVNASSYFSFGSNLNSTAPVTYYYNGSEYTGYLGNFWDGFSAMDEDGNGIFDVPYAPGGCDYYPLVGPYEDGVIKAPDVMYYPVSIELAPDEITILRGESKGFTATAFDNLGRKINGATFTWSTSNESVGTVDQNGLFSATNKGNTTITASLNAPGGTVTGSANVSVIGEYPVLIELAPHNIMVLKGDSREFAARAFDGLGREVSNVTYVWSSSNESIGNVDKNGSFSATGAGDVTVIASLDTPDGMVKGSANVSVIEEPSGSMTFSVDDDLPADFSVLEDATSFARDGDTVVVRDGNYTGNIVIKRSIVLKSENGPDYTRLSTGSTINVQAGDVTIEGLSFGSLNLINVEHCVVRNNTLSGSRNDAIYIENAAACIIENNSLSASSNALYLTGSTNNVILDNRLKSARYGILVRGESKNNLISNNTIESCRYGICLSDAGVTSNKIWRNTITSCSSYGLNIRSVTGNVFFLNNISTTKTYVTSAKSLWNTTTPVTYLFNGVEHTGYLGNYWATYSGTDTDGDGVGDDPYAVVGSEVDSYPLVSPPDNYIILKATAITVTPASATLKVGESANFTAELFDLRTEVTSDTGFIWSSSNETVGVVNTTTGHFEALSPGSTTVTASAEDVNGTAQVTVTAQTPTAVKVSPEIADLIVGGTCQFTATAEDQTGQAMTGIEFTWTSSNMTVGVVNATTGNFEALSPGTATVTASAGGVTGTAQATVTVRTATAIKVSPEMADLVVGGTCQFTATAEDQTGQAISGVEFTWTSSNTAVGVVNATTGNFEALSPGTTTVTASAGGATGTAQVTVTAQTLTTIKVSPEVVDLIVGGTRQFTATAEDQAGHAMPGVEFTWTSSNETVGTIDENGLFTALNAGDARVIAKNGSVRGTAQVSIRSDAHKIIYVDAAGGADYTSIQEALAACNDGDLIIVKDGKYQETVTVDKSVTIRSENGLASTELYPDESGFVITADGVEISGITVVRATGRGNYGIKVLGAADCRITNNRIFSCREGILLDGATRTLVENNAIEGVNSGNKAFAVINSTSGTFSRNFFKSGLITVDAASTGNRWYSDTVLCYEFSGTVYTSCLGNRYPGYSGVDTNGNGIGDEQYVITGNETDAYPLVSLPSNYRVLEAAIIDVKPAVVTLDVGGSVNFAAEVFDQRGERMPGADLTWTSSNTAVGVVNATTGNFEALSPGTTTVMASAGGATGTAQVTVSGSSGGDAPVANFTANVTSGDAPLTVAFTDTSSGSPTAWAWDFENDGVIDSTEQNPVHTYTAPGTYTVNLTVTNDAGSDSAAKTGYITVSSGVPVTPDVASITVEPASVNLTNGATQQFSAVAYDTEGTEVPDISFAWSSSNTSVGSLSQAGLFTAVALGTATVTAAYGNVTGTAVVTVVTPPQGDQTQDTPLEIPGCNVTTGNDGKPQVSINTSSGTGVTVENNTNTITITQETYTLTIETEDAPAFDNDTVSGTVANIRLETNPIATDLASLGTVRASVSLNLTGLPAGAGLTTTVSQNVSADAQSAFQLAASADGLTLGDVAYTMNIVKTNLTNGQDIAGATIRMTVSPEWVEAHGGAKAVRIIRFAEDDTREVLATRLVDTDASGNLVFEAASPNGLSTFGLAAVSAAPQAAPTSSSRSSGGGGSQASAGAASNLKAGESVSLTMDRTAISAVTLTAADQGVKDALVTVAKGSLPRDAEAPAGAVYQYVEATLYRAAAEDFSSIQFRFTVPTTWLAEHGCTAEEIGLLRHTADGWQAVPVEVLGEENGNAVFSASPEGFSLFAIAVTEKVPGVTDDTTPEPTGTEVPAETVTTDVPTDTTPATPQPTPLPVWVAILALGVLLFVRRT